MSTNVKSGSRNLTELDSRVSVLTELLELLETRYGRRMHPFFRERLLAVAELADGTGYGYGDSVNDLVHELEILDQG